MGTVMATLKRAAFEIAASDLAVEMVGMFLRELQQAGADTGATQRHVATLATVLGDRLETANACAVAAGKDLHAFGVQLEDFTRQIRTLDILHVTGRVETTCCAGAETFYHTLHDLQTSTAKARGQTTALIRMLESVRVEPVESASLRRDLAVLTGA
jgi:hypothetical protein